MSKLEVKQNSNTENTRGAIFSRKISIVSTCMVFAFCCMSVFSVAFAAGAATDVINGIVRVVCLICNVVGIIFALVGFVKVAIAHANEDGPAQQKAALMIATGIVLIVLGATKILGIDFSSWLTTA